MSSLGSPNSFFLAGKKAYEVDRSLRFNLADSTYLGRTSASASSTFTLSLWLKRGICNTNDNRFQYIFAAGNYGLLFQRYGGGFSLNGTGGELTNDARFRDPSAWYHIVLSMNSGTATTYVNNTVIHNAVTGFSLTTGSDETRLGRRGNGNYPFDGYMAEINFVDGQAYDPSYFAETDVITGQWNPKKYGGGYGTNGFYLNFSDNSGTTATTLGKDSSGNGNNFTPNNFSVSAWPDTDSLEDTPTNNFCTLNPLDKNSNVILVNGNLQTATTGTGGHYPVFSTMSMKGGKWYVEAKLLTNDGFLGSIMNIQHDGGSLNVDSTVGNNTSAVNKVGYGLMTGSGQKSHNGTLTNYGSALSGSDVWMCAFDADNGKIYWGKNGTWFDSGDPSAGSNAAYTGIDISTTWNFAWHHYGNNNNVSVNFGQQGFTYTPPTGFVALNSANLPDPTIKLPNKHFDTLLYTGNGSSQTLSGLNFAPDWVWIKIRSQSYDHAVFDTIRGATKDLETNQTGAEQTRQMLTAFTSDGFSVGNDTQANKSGDTFVAWNWDAGETDGKTYTVTVVSDSGNKYRFDGFGTSAVTLDLAEGGTYIFNYPSAHPLKFSTTADGTHGGGSEYTTGVTHNSSTQVTIVVAASAPTLYYYCQNHSGMGGQVNTNSTLGSSNFDGAIQSVVKTSPTAGFSISTYTGNGTTGSTIGHGLGVKPDAIIIKCRSNSDNWMVYHKGVNAGVDPEDYYLKLNSIDAQANSVIMLNDTAPTSSVITFQNDSTNNLNGRTYVMYAFSEVSSYSKFGFYTGNGNADGPFVFTSFKIAFLLIRGTHSDLWYIYDNKRNTFNVVDKELNSNNSQSEATFTTVDFLSNGFKIRTSNSSFNYNNYTYIYIAFAEAPFRNARAR
tara:strand:+ start:397 stop:3063 length:2667 start_codon:yes stop_codon:yes gene_type:complete